MTERVLMIGQRQVTCADVADVARGRVRVQLSQVARDAVEASHRAAVEVAGRRALYGRTTGVGAQSGVDLSGSTSHAQALLHSHATSAGGWRSPDRVRAMVVVRLNQLAAGGSGISPAVVEALTDLLRADALPRIRELGGIGTGDLPALAGLALALQGDRPTSQPLPRSVIFGQHDALPFLSSSAPTLADAALVVVDLERVARAAVAVASLTFVALGGNAEAFDPVVERVSPFEGARQVCRWMRALIEGDDGSRTHPRRIQDPYGLRALPQVHGALLDASAAMADLVHRMMGAPSENPVVLDGLLAHHGGFHTASLATSLDTVRSAAAQSGQLVLARLSSLCRPELTGLPPFLGDGRAGAHGVMLLEYVGAAALADLRALTTPTAPGAATLSLGVEDDASFAPTGARQAAESVRALEVLVSCELVAAVRAARASRLPVARLVAQALDACTDLPTDRADRDLTPDLDTAATVLPALAELLAGTR